MTATIHGPRGQNDLQPMPTTMLIPQPVSESAAIISMVERMARDPAVDVDKLRQILQLRLEIENRENERAYDRAMTAAQAEMEPVRKDASNPQTHSKYATLNAVDRALRPIYTQHGFGLSFDTGDAPSADMVRVLCFVTCAGHKRTYKVDMPADGKGAKGNDVMTRTHATGSAITYGRRYLELMIFNVSVGSDKDDEGNAASPQAQATRIIDPAQAENLKSIIVNVGANLEAFLKYFEISAIELLPLAKHKTAMDMLAKKTKAKAKAKP